ncbi:MAG TPA: L,D-transpeptidase [Rhizobiales bacterium]|nr:L,D-transpeptidase [Hyphomicrobiales bacterium]
MLVTGLGGLAALTIPGTALAESRETRFNFTGSFGSSSSYRSTYRGKKLVKFRSNEPVGTLIIKTSERRLYRVLPNGMAMKYGVGVGRRGFEWSGIARIKVKKEWPAWRPPAEMIQRELVKYGRRLPDVMPGGPNNPLGARAMYLFKGNRDTLYRIHGTNNPASIGKAQSSGCIRMMNEEIIELYNKTPIGTKVIVI